MIFLIKRELGKVLGLSLCLFYLLMFRLLVRWFKTLPGDSTQLILCEE